MSPWRERLHEIIFESDTPAGKAFDVALIWCIVISVGLVLLESMAEVRLRHQKLLYAGEWFFTLVFTAEYFLRILSVRNARKYVFSFFGLIDLLAILPTYLSLIFPGTQSLLVVRTFRLLRVFRVFKLGTYLGEAQVLYQALRASRPKITVFLVAVVATVVTMGATMYLVEGEANGFSSIPKGIYWSIVTMTTVGFGDITPKTPLGQMLASCLMIIGYGIIAVPTGIVTTELARAARLPLHAVSSRACHACGRDGHEFDAIYCKFCSTML